MTILIPVIIVAVIGLLLGLGLALAGKYLSDPPDEKFEVIREALPGANCGACGYTGCDDYASAVKDGIAKPNLCIPGGNDTASALSEVLGIEVEAVKKAAFVACKGDCSVTGTKYAYNGLMSCAAAAALYGGPTDCSFGCIGFGDCQKACEYGGIQIVDGLARIDTDTCKACGKCATVCPKGIISIIPVNNAMAVGCKNTEKGAKTMKVCTTGCIGCTKCVKVCKFDAIKVENFLAKIDPEKCTGCGECAKACARGCITK